MEGFYRVEGYTINCFDGNKTDLSNLIIYLKNGQLSASGYYTDQLNSNNRRSTMWRGTYNGINIQWIEYYGNCKYPFKYNGFIQNNNIWGTYRWTFNHAVGSFNFQLQLLNREEQYPLSITVNEPSLISSN